jgi:hypothetical protein
VAQGRRMKRPVRTLDPVSPFHDTVGEIDDRDRGTRNLAQNVARNRIFHPPRPNGASFQNSPTASFHASPLDRGSIGCSFFHGGIGTPLALIGEMAEHPGQCLGPVVMGAPGNPSMVSRTWISWCPSSVSLAMVSISVSSIASTCFCVFMAALFRLPAITGLSENHCRPSRSRVRPAPHWVELW